MRTLTVLMTLLVAMAFMPAHSPSVHSEDLECDRRTPYEATQTQPEGTQTSPEARREPISENLYKEVTDSIKAHEALRLGDYEDAEGFPTIGYGHLIRKGDPLQITEEQADSMLYADYDYCIEWIKRDTGIKEGARLHALAHWLYCYGTSKWHKSTLRKRVLSQQADSVPIELSKWRLIQGKVNNHLVKMRIFEKKLWSSG